MPCWPRITAVAVVGELAELEDDGAPAAAGARVGDHGANCHVLEHDIAGETADRVVDDGASATTPFGRADDGDLFAGDGDTEVLDRGADHRGHRLGDSRHPGHQRDAIRADVLDRGTDLGRRCQRLADDEIAVAAQDYRGRGMPVRGRTPCPEAGLGDDQVDGGHHSASGIQASWIRPSVLRVT